VEAQGRVADKATAQGGVVSLDQLRAEGVSRRRAAERADANSLHRVHRGVYAVGHRSATRVTHLRAALLACGEGAVISHGTAAALHGFWDSWPLLIDVTVPVEAGRKIEGIRCRRCRYPEPEEVEVRHRVDVETDGRETHETPTAFQGDRRRDQFLAAAGYRVLRVTWHQIHGEHAAVLRRISRAVSPRTRR
jgi:Transcriptional regulator, AbiEi antitoxin/Protein of unknown function (DUF559)